MKSNCFKFYQPLTIMHFSTCSPPPPGNARAVITTSGSSGAATHSASVGDAQTAGIIQICYKLNHYLDIYLANTLIF